MPRKSSSNYEKLTISAYEKCDIHQVDTLHEYYDSKICLDKYFKGIPWDHVELKNNLEEVIQQFKDSVKEEITDRIIDIWRLKTPRYRPAYEKTLRYILENNEVLEYVITEYWRRPSEVYKRISMELGLAYSTVRDSFWSFRRAGIL